MDWFASHLLVVRRQVHARGVVPLRHRLRTRELVWVNNGSYMYEPRGGQPI
jgi:hypothetical protein